MSKLQGVFDIRTLEDHQLGHLMFVLNSPSYLDVFEPYLRNIRESLNKKLLDPSQFRKDELPDDFIRGGISTLDGLLTLFDQLIQETEIERIARTQVEKSDEESYQDLRHEGKIKPITGIGRYDPDEDF